MAGLHNAVILGQWYLFLRGIRSCLGQESRLMRIQWQKMCWVQEWRQRRYTALYASISNKPGALTE